jgi:DNA-binding NtrC family response regulator
MAKILIIDDDDVLRRFLQDALEQRGHQVRCLEHAKGGPDVLATGEFELVLVDENMPGLSGTEFLKAVRKLGLGTPAVLMTGYAKGEIIQAVKELDVFVVGKPAGGYDEFWKELEPYLAEA